MIPRHLAELRTKLAVLLPKRRSERRYLRHVKIKMAPSMRNRRDPPRTEFTK